MSENVDSDVLMFATKEDLPEDAASQYGILLGGQNTVFN